MCEYAPNKILALTLGNCMFILHDFSVIKFIDDQNYDNIEKNQPKLIPNFDEERFPFILLAG